MRTGDPILELSALHWSVNAMRAATDVLPSLGSGDRRQAFAAIGEAVWGITIVDATLMRHYPAAYDAVAADLTGSQRRVTEETLAGLRFVRNRIGQKVDLAELVDASDSDAAKSAATDWTWKSVSGPDLASRSSRAQAWELNRYRAYQAQLVGHTVGESVERAVAFLQRIAADIATPLDAHSAR